MFNCEKLESWQHAIDFADAVYSFADGFPADERFSLTSQLRRAAVSIPSNIAEGSSRSSRSDNARFVEIATVSLFEVVTQMTLARRRQLLAEAAYAQIYARAERQSRMLSGLRRSLLDSTS